MIVMYPLLVSKSVSKSALPGIIKVLERYIIIYELDYVLNAGRPGEVMSKSQYKIKRGKLIIKEDEGLLDPDEVDPGTKNKGKKDVTLSDFEKQSRKLDLEIGILDKKSKDFDKAIERAEERDDKRDIERLKNEEEKNKIQIDNVKQQRVNNNLAAAKLRTDQKRSDLEKEKWEAQKKSAKVDVDISDMQSISLEPTYLRTTRERSDGSMVTDLLGVKVVPAEVKSEEELVHMMLYDKQMGKIKKMVVSAGRNFNRKIKRISTTIWSAVPIIGGGRTETPTGDPRKDIIMQETAFDRRLFALINRADLDDNFFQSAKRINRLYSQGWCSFIIADDVNKIVYFCMKHMKGMCSMLPYATMYNTLGHLKVFESLEDLRRASTSLFKISKSEKKLFGESLATSKLSDYQKLRG